MSSLSGRQINQEEIKIENEKRKHTAFFQQQNYRNTQLHALLIASVIELMMGVKSTNTFFPHLHICPLELNSVLHSKRNSIMRKFYAISFRRG